MTRASKEVKLLKYVSIGLAGFMFIWGLLNLSNSPYGDIGKIMGLGQIAFAVVILYIYWRF